MRLPSALFAVLAGVIFAAWWWIGLPVQMPPSPLESGEKLQCVSYAPFRPGQSPFDPGTRVEPQQVDEDMARLAPVTQCVRTYASDFGSQYVPEAARRHGLKVIQGIWISGEPEKNRIQIRDAVDLAKRYPDVIVGVVVGNEVLLRGEMTAADLLNTIRSVKVQVGDIPVTYADVWEFWLRNPVLLDGVDFVTVHILPYWEDFPIATKEAGAHIDAIRQKVADAFPGKEILIGETGWPSAGRMREGALPSPASQALVMHDLLTLAKRQHYRVNLIEAFDQPWKRVLEGTVGGHWGLLDADNREVKFTWGGAVSNHPLWVWQAAGGVALAFFTFAAAWFAARRELTAREWLTIAAIALGPGILAGWAIGNAPMESLGVAGWAQSLALVAVTLVAPLVTAAALASDISLPSFARVMTWGADRSRSPLGSALGAVLIVTSLLALERALSLTFNPRYIDFAFAPLTAAVLPYLVFSFARPAKGKRGTAEIVMAGTLALSAPYIVLNETFANWQALWLSGALLALALILLRSRAAPG